MPRYRAVSSGFTFCSVETGLPGWACRTRTGESVRELSGWNSVTTSPEVGQAWRQRTFACKLHDSDLQLRRFQQTIFLARPPQHIRNAPWSRALVWRPSHSYYPRFKAITVLTLGFPFSSVSACTLTRITTLGFFARAFAHSRSIISVFSTSVSNRFMNNFHDKRHTAVPDELALPSFNQPVGAQRNGKAEVLRS
jgi:hypothetical protein